MKRYLLFICAGYYPRGGWSDFVDTFDTIAEARERAGTPEHSWVQIVDTETMCEIDPDDVD